MAFPIFVALLFWLLASQATVHATTENASMMVERHEAWMTRYGRTYKDEAEKEKRFKIFKENVEYIESFNKDGTHSYKLGVNKFADMTSNEFKASHTGYKMDTRIQNSSSKKASSFRYENMTDQLPSSVDWRKKGAVTGVKDQGACGCCWAFSTVGAVEGMHKLSTGKLVSLSEQELVDCDRMTNVGCNGGLMTDAFKFIIKNGLTSEKNYPYNAKDQYCNTKKEKPINAKISSYEKLPQNSESALQKAVANQPVSVAVDADIWQFYNGGVLDGNCGNELNHGVIAVGYGETRDGTKYWLVKNSWGEDWGEKGYIRMKRDVEVKDGLCGITLDASYPIA